MSEMVEVSQEMIDYINESVANQSSHQNMQLVCDWIDDSYHMEEVK